MKAKPASNYVDGLSCRDDWSRCTAIYSRNTVRFIQFSRKRYLRLTLKNLAPFQRSAKMSFHFRNFILAIILPTAFCGPKFDDGGFVPSSMAYLEKAGKSQDQIAIPSQTAIHSDPSRKLGETVSNDITDRSQEPRFGFTNIGSTGSGYGVSAYPPAKIDLGGLLLGAIIGVGSILIIPKLLYVLSGTYGAYARSEENGFAQTMTKLDDVLARHGIDTTSCMQRAVCTYSQQAAASIKEANQLKDEEKISSFDRMVDTITTNQLFRTAMEGTAIQEAVEAGRTGRSCSRSYPHCGVSMETTLSLLSNVVAAVTIANTSTVTPIPTAKL